MRRQFKKMAFVVLMLSIFPLFSGCGTIETHFTYNDTFQPNKPQYGKGCYEAAVLLTVNLSRAKEIADRVLVGLDGKITDDGDTYIRAVRKLHRYALIAGSGGEDLAVRLEKIDDHRTFVTATTMTMGGLTSKAWSCRIIDEMIRMAAQ